jgi:hypothetical protein
MKPSASLIAALAILVVSLVTSCWSVEVDFNETIEEPAGFVPTPLLGDKTAFQLLLDICAADPSCAEITGQSVTQNLDTFIHIIQLTSPFESDPPVLESACVDCVFNKTLQEICDKITQLLIENAFLKSHFVCGLNERPRLSGGMNETIKCEPLPGRAQVDNVNISALAIFVLILALILLALVAAKKTYIAWTHSRTKVVKAHEK